jgi:hypothetical protein
MHSPKVSAWAAVAIIVAVVMAGCSGGGDEPDPEPAATTAAVDPPAPAPPRRLLPAHLSDLDEHCLEHRGFDDAAEYAGDGPHPVAVIDREDYRLHQLARESLPGGWLPERPREAELVACVRRSGGDTRLGECDYTALIIGAAADATIPLYSQEYEFRVYSLRIPAPLVAEFTVEAVEGGCPERIDYDDGEPPERVMPDLTGPELEAALAEVVTSPA